MGTEHDVARGIQRQKVAQGRAQFVSSLGCAGIAFVVFVLLVLVGVNAFVGTLIAVVVGFVLTIPLYRRVLGRNLNP